MSKFTAYDHNACPVRNRLVSVRRPQQGERSFTTPQLSPSLFLRNHFQYIRQKHCSFIFQRWARCMKRDGEGIETTPNYLRYVSTTRLQNHGHFRAIHIYRLDLMAQACMKIALKRPLAASSLSPVLVEDRSHTICDHLQKGRLLSSGDIL